MTTAAPAPAGSSVWGWIQPAIADTTRVCAYDRAGGGGSLRGDPTSVVP
jgi:hypothetical protein